MPRELSKDTLEIIPRLFYLCPVTDHWLPTPDDPQELIDVLSNGEEIQLKRVDMTDEEFKNIPEA